MWFFWLNISYVIWCQGVVACVYLSRAVYKCLFSMTTRNLSPAFYICLMILKSDEYRYQWQVFLELLSCHFHMMRVSNKHHQERWHALSWKLKDGTLSEGGIALGFCWITRERVYQKHEFITGICSSWRL